MQNYGYYTYYDYENSKIYESLRLKKRTGGIFRKSHAVKAHLQPAKPDLLPLQRHCQPTF